MFNKQNARMVPSRQAMSRHRRRRLVQVNTHALEQYRARGGRGNLQKVVEGRLRSQLKRGVTTTGDLLVEVPVSRGLKALCTPKFYGGWLCITVLERDWGIA
jgi:hypothetical protein